MEKYNSSNYLQMREIGRFIRIFSLDIVAGALASCYLAGLLLDADIEFPAYLVLGLTVFFIYSFDHLMDGLGKGDKKEGITYHYFFQHHRYLTVMVLLTGVSVVVISLFWLEVKIILFGLVLSTLTGLYFLLHFLGGRLSRHLFPKEISISLIYSLATWGLAWLNSVNQVKPSEILMFSVFTLMVFSNVMTYTFYDFETARLITTLHKKTGRKPGLRILIIILLLFCILLTCVNFLFYRSEPGSIYIIYFLMNLTLLVPLLFSNLPFIRKYYGTLADAAFILPGLLWIAGLFS